MKKLVVLFLVSLLMISLPVNIYAQEEPPKYQAYLINDDLVKPSMLSKYEEGLKEYISVFSENNFPYPIYMYNTSDYHYYYVIPVPTSFSGLDSVYKYFDKAVKANPEKWEGVWEKFEGTYEYNKNQLIIYNRELSYIPENPRLKPEEHNYCYWAFTYVLPGKTKEFKEVLKKWKELYKSNNITEGYSVFWGDFGTEQPLWIWQINAKDPQDFWTQNKIIHETMDEEIQKLWMETSKYVRKVENKNGWFRRDVSYFLKEKE